MFTGNKAQESIIMDGQNSMTIRNIVSTNNTIYQRSFCNSLNAEGYHLNGFLLNLNIFHEVLKFL